MEHHQETVMQNHKNISVLRHDMRHNYRILYTMLQSGNVNDAMEFIRQQEGQLADTTIRLFCQSPLVNSALSIYIDRAESMGIHVEQKINLPSHFSTAEDDFAVLLANLLENAIRASRQQPENKRAISLIVQHSGSQCVLELANMFDEPLPLGENGLPQSSREGHELGMVSLTNFAEKYNAYVDFAQEDGWVKISVYWEDKSE